jgi:signal peptidase I
VNARLDRAVHWGRQALLTGGAVLGAVCLLLAIGAVGFGLRPLVFQSGSMSPTIDTGALALSHRVDAESLEVGQVVSVPTESGTRVTHRIVDITHGGSTATLRLQGDANEAPDAQLYPVSQADVVVFDVPRLGYAVGWLSGPMGLFLLGLYAAFLVSVMVRRSPRSGSGDGGPAEPLSAEERVVPPSGKARRASDPGNGARRVMVTGGLSALLAVGALAGAGAQSSVTQTLAAWSDQVDVAGTTLTTYTVPPPPSATTSAAVCTPLNRGSGNEQGVTFTWSNADPTVVFTATVSPATVVLIQNFAVTAAGKTTLTITYSGPQSAKSTQATVTVQSSAPSAPTWTSTPVTVGRFTTGSSPNSQPTCG